MAVAGDLGPAAFSSCAHVFKSYPPCVKVCMGSYGSCTQGNGCSGICLHGMMVPSPYPLQGPWAWLLADCSICGEMLPAPAA